MVFSHGISGAVITRKGQTDGKNWPHIRENTYTYELIPQIEETVHKKSVGIGYPTTLRKMTNKMDQEKLCCSKTPRPKPRHTPARKWWDKVAWTAHSLRVSYIPQSWFYLCLLYRDIMKEAFIRWLPCRRRVRRASEWTHFPLAEAMEDTLLHKKWLREMNHLLKSSVASCLTVLLLMNVWLGMGSRENSI